MKRIFPVFAILLILSALPSFCGELRQISFIESADQLIACIESHFYNARFLNQQFREMKAGFRKKVETISGEEEYKSAVKAMLAEFKVSHTAYYTSEDPEYYQIATVFEQSQSVKRLFNDREILYPSIGIKTAKVGSGLFVQSVLEGSPACRAGILRGDEIIDADGKPYLPVSSLRGRTGRPLQMRIRRAENGEVKAFSVTPEMINPREEYLRAERASVEIIEANGRKIGYIHIWSYAGEHYHKAFLHEISDGKLKEADSLIWDLRDGWGGAWPQYLNVFNRDVPLLVMTARDDKPYTYDQQWRKPVVMLINEGSRSGKEILAYGFRKHSIGTIVGEKTAGMVLGGTLFVQSDRSLLYLAVAGVTVDGDCLEGKGVEPDITIPRPLPYSAGKDEQKQKAIDLLQGTKVGTAY